MMPTSSFPIQQPLLGPDPEACSRCEHQYDYDHLPFIICSEEHMVCEICRRTITHCPQCQGQLLPHHQSVSKLIKTINNLRYKVQSLIDVGTFPLNNEKKSFDIIFAINSSVFRNFTPAHLLKKFEELFSHPGHQRVAKISMFMMVYKIKDSAFQYAYVANLSQLRNFLLYQTPQHRVQPVRPNLQEASLIQKGLNAYQKKDCRIFILLTDSLDTEDSWFMMKNWVSSSITMRKCLLFCLKEQQRKKVGEETANEVFTFQELGYQLSKIKRAVDFEVEHEQ